MVAMTLPAKPWTNGMMTADGTRMFDSSVGSEGAWRATPIPAGGLPAGSVINWSSGTLPPNWLLCDGSAVSRTLYPSLFAAIGTTYGSGDGSTTFNVPDVPNGDAGGIIGNVKLNSSVSITTTDSDLSGLTQTIPMKAGRSYEIMLSAPNMPSSNGTNRANIRFVVDGSAIDGHYTNTTVGGLILTARTIYTPTTDGNKTVKIKGVVDLGGGTITLYADLSSSIYFTITDLGESTTALRQRSIIKATTGWSAGDSELALRMAAVETANSTTNKSGLVPIKPSQLSVAAGGTASFDANGVVTVNGVGNVYLWDVFTSLYRNYRVVIESTKSTDSVAYMGIQLHNAGVESAGSYNMGSLQIPVNGTSLTQNGTYNGGYSVLCQHYYNGGICTITLDIFGPALASETGISGMANGKTAAIPTENIISGQHGLATAYSGLKVLLTTNTWSGKVRVYGYN